MLRAAVYAGVERVHGLAEPPPDLMADVNPSSLLEVKHHAAADDAPLLFSGEGCRAARLRLGWSQGQLAARAGVSRSMVTDFELGLRKKRGSLGGLKAQVRRALEVAGARFADG